ncbi:hypothetical protein TWF696_004586 [Orbilia brochopaga]|uniref:F-box domain-containing protein n=1 Tax=Orbilia brochopaga TaxID=3140254 RepID=A0AAV9V7S4_9PEZI
MAGASAGARSLVARGLSPEVLREIFRYLPIKTLKNLCLSCSLFRQIAAEFAFSWCTVYLHAINGLDVTRMKRILASSIVAIACVRDFAVVLDIESTSAISKSRPGNPVVAASLAERPEQERLLLKVLVRLKASRLRSVSITRHLLLTPETVFAIPKMHPNITHLSIRPGRLVEFLNKPQHPQLDIPFINMTTTWHNLQHLSLDLRQRRIGYNVPGALHIAMEFISRNCATLQSLAVEIDRTPPQLESSDGLHHLLSNVTSDTPGTESDWRPFLSREHTTFPTRLPVLTKLQLTGWPYLLRLQRLFARDLWQPSLLTVLRLDLCRFADKFMTNLADSLTGLKSLALSESCVWSTLAMVLPKLRPLDSLFLRFPCPEGQWTDYAEALRVHRESLRFLWLECLHPDTEQARGAAERTLTESAASSIAKMPRLEELAIPEFLNWPQATFVSSKVLSARSPRILRVLSPPQTVIEQAFRETVVPVAAMRLLATAEVSGKVVTRLPNLQLVVFGAWKMGQTIEGTAGNTPKFWHIRYENDGGELASVVENVTMADVRRLFPKSPILNYDAGERDWVDVVDVEACSTSRPCTACNQ